MDAYYRDCSDLEPHRRAALNFDSPDAIDQPLLLQHALDLTQGRAVKRPVYRFDSHTRCDESIRLEPGSHLIVEGLFALFWPQIRRLYDLAIFVEAPDGVCLQRRVERDSTERGRTPEAVIKQYRRYTRPMYRHYVEPTRAAADLQLDGTHPVEDMIRQALYSLRVHNSGRRSE